MKKGTALISNYVTHRQNKRQTNEMDDEESASKHRDRTKIDLDFEVNDIDEHAPQPQT